MKFDRRVAIRLRGMTPRKAAELARSITISIDSQAAYERAEANRRDSFVSLFPDRDGVAVLQVRGRAEQMLAIFNALPPARAEVPSLHALRGRTAPTGHNYRSTPPPVIPGNGRPPGRLRQ